MYNTAPVVHVLHTYTHARAHADTVFIYTFIYLHIYMYDIRKEIFIAEGSLLLAQFYYRNNVKAASFEDA